MPRAAGKGARAAALDPSAISDPDGTGHEEKVAALGSNTTNHRGLSALYAERQSSEQPIVYAESLPSQGAEYAPVLQAEAGLAPVAVAPAPPAPPPPQIIVLPSGSGGQQAYAVSSPSYETSPTAAVASQPIIVIQQPPTADAPPGAMIQSQVISQPQAIAQPQQTVTPSAGGTVIINPAAGIAPPQVVTQAQQTVAQLPTVAAPPSVEPSVAATPRPLPILPTGPLAPASAASTMPFPSASSVAPSMTPGVPGGMMPPPGLPGMMPPAAMGMPGAPMGPPSSLNNMQPISQTVPIGSNPPGMSGMMPGGMPGMMPGGMPGMMPGGMPGMMPGAMAMSQPHAMSGMMPGMMPNMMPGTMPGMAAGMNPAMNAALSGMMDGMSFGQAIEMRNKQKEANKLRKQLGGFKDLVPQGVDVSEILEKFQDSHKKSVGGGESADAGEGDSQEWKVRLKRAVGRIRGAMTKMSGEGDDTGPPAKMDWSKLAPGLADAIKTGKTDWSEVMEKVMPMFGMRPLDLEKGGRPNGGKTVGEIAWAAMGKPA